MRPFPVVLLTIYAWFDPNLRSILGLAWDCGAVTTGRDSPSGPVFGIGIANAAGKGGSSLSGSVWLRWHHFPDFGCAPLHYYFFHHTREIIFAQSAAGSATTEMPSIWNQTPGDSPWGASYSTSCDLFDVRTFCSSQIKFAEQNGYHQGFGAIDRWCVFLISVLLTVWVLKQVCFASSFYATTYQ